MLLPGLVFYCKTDDGKINVPHPVQSYCMKGKREREREREKGWGDAMQELPEGEGERGLMRCRNCSLQNTSSYIVC
jgi:hypothetical protein